MKRKKYWKLGAITLLFLMMLAGIRLLWISQLSPLIDIGKSIPGKMDFQETESEDTLFPLVGEWDYYPDVLLTTEEIKSKQYGEITEKKYYPEGWLEESATKEYTYGTFHLQVTLQDNLLDELLSIHVPNTRLASRLFVNGEVLGESGNPTTSMDDFSASIAPYVGNFQVSNPTIDIVLHVANNGINQSVPNTPITLGETDTLQTNLNIAFGSKLIVVATFIFMLLISLYMYFIERRNQRIVWIYLALLSIGVILTTLMDYVQVLLIDLPTTYEIKAKVLRVAHVLTSLVIFLYFKHILPKYTITKWFDYYPILNLLHVLFLIVMPLSIITQYAFFTAIIFLIPLIYFSGKVFFAVKNNEPHAFLLFLMGISLLNNMLWNILNHFTPYLSFEYYPVDGLIAVVLFVLYWIRRYVQHTEEVQILSNELIVKDKEKDEFLTQTSHELRNPLHSIINIAQLVLDNRENIIAKDDKENLKLLLSVGNRMSLLVDDLLDLTLINDNRLRLVKREVHIDTVVNIVVEMLAYQVIEKDIVIRNKIGPNFPPVYGDENRLIQAVLNIVHNAIKFTDEGEIVITAKHANGVATIEIADTGKGIEQENIDHIFEPFYKDSEIEGIGIGLQITKQLIQLHGGEISIVSTADTGTIVSFTLLLCTEIERSKEMKDAELMELSLMKRANEEEAHKLPEGNAIRILLVDDDQVNLKVIANVLRTEHYEVETAFSGQEAIQKIYAIPFDLVISDVMMPGMSGYTLTKEIRNEFSLSELPVILLTARARAEDLNTGFRAGANDYVKKPVDPLELKARVKALTDLQKTLKEQLIMEAAWLRAQINPHFLYNTINSIIIMAKRDSDKMHYLLEKFVYFLRTSYDFQGKEVLVPLKEELALVDAYLTIEEERFGERLQIIWGIDESLDILIPPLSLQTLVENALEHGILNRIQGGTITLQSIDEAEYVDLVIKDDGVGMSQTVVESINQGKLIGESGIGLLNTNKRLKKWLQTSLMIESELEKGTKITIRVKKNK